MAEERASPFLNFTPIWGEHGSGERLSPFPSFYETNIFIHFRQDIFIGISDKTVTER